MTRRINVEFVCPVQYTPAIKIKERVILDCAGRVMDSRAVNTFTEKTGEYRLPGRISGRDREDYVAGNE